MKNNKTYEDYLVTYYNDNYKWKKEDVAKLYKYENPDWNRNRCLKEANLIYKELKKMNRKMWDDNKMYFKYNKPFSFFENRDDEFEEVFFDRNSN